MRRDDQNEPRLKKRLSRDEKKRGKGENWQRRLSRGSGDQREAEKKKKKEKLACSLREHAQEEWGTN